MNVVHASRSPYRAVPGSVTTTAEDGSTVVTPTDVQVADYRIVVCHDAKCPGEATKGHSLDGPLRQNHHDFRFVSDARTTEEIMADVASMEQAEAADTGPIAI